MDRGLERHYQHEFGTQRLKNLVSEALPVPVPVNQAVSESVSQSVSRSIRRSVSESVSKSVSLIAEGVALITFRFSNDTRTESGLYPTQSEGSSD